MKGFRVKRLQDVETVSYGPMSDLRVLVGDNEGSTPIRAALQTCKPGYDVPFHCHPYTEFLILLEGDAEFRIEVDGVQTVRLQKGEVVELHAGVWHAFTTSATQDTVLLGIHVSSERIVNYRGAVKTDSRGFRLKEDADSGA